MKYKITGIGLLLFGFSSTGFAVDTWYYGKITRVWLQSNTQFIVTLDSGTVDDCANKYVYFRASTVGQDYVNKIYGTALSAFLSKSTVGIVIDKDVLFAGSSCDGKSMDVR